MADVYLKWDGCCEWERHEDSQHTCGFDYFCKQRLIEQEAYKKAFSLIKHGSKEEANLK